MAFDKAKFEVDFNNRIGSLAKGEKTVRAEINVLSRTVLEAVHATENIGYVNSMLRVLTPVNKNAAIEFFQHFTGFHFDEASRMFTTKSKKRYIQAEKLAMEFLQDPNNNMFSWAERAKLGRAETEFKPDEFLKKAHKNFMKYIQTARDHGISQKELFSIMFKPEEGKPGVDAEALVAVLAAMGEVNVVEEEEATI